jgi:hypothetical protein
MGRCKRLEGYSIFVEKVREHEGKGKSREEGQNMVLELVKQGYSAEQIEAKLAAAKSDGTETAGK